MKTLISILVAATDYLKEKKIAHPRRQAEEVISDALGIPRLEIYMQHDKPLTEEEITLCRARIMRRGKAEPVAYIAGKVTFLDCLIELTPDVLIPRQETELMAAHIAKELNRESLVGKVLWDICCGSGCLGISLKKQCPDLHVILSDICPKAAKQARMNGRGLEVREGDLFEVFSGEKAHFIVCNPPYISPAEYEVLEPEVKDYEPKKALVAEDAGLAFYKRLAMELPKYLERGAKVWLEIGSSQGESVKKIFDAPCWSSCLLHQDLAGHDRFFSLEFE